MVYEPRAFDRAAIVNGLLEGIENEACVCCLACPPADDAARIGVDDQSHTDAPLQVAT